MNIVKICGSPAQQMFQYAFYYALLQHDPEARLHVPSEKWINSRFHLPRFVEASADDLKQFGKGSIGSRMSRKTTVLWLICWRRKMLILMGNGSRHAISLRWKMISARHFRCQRRCCRRQWQVCSTCSSRARPWRCKCMSLTVPIIPARPTITTGRLPTFSPRSTIRISMCLPPILIG